MSKKSNRKHVFISHHHADDAAVDKMTSLLQKSGHDMRNSSIRAKRANREKLEKGLIRESVIRRLLRRKISWSSTVVVLVGKETHSRSWVDWEIEEANKQGKRIVGVFERGGTESDIPTPLERYASAIVGWNSESIVNAIDGKENHFENPDCTPRQSVHYAVSTRC